MWSSRATILAGMFVLIVAGYVAYGALALGWFNNEPILITYRTEDPPLRPERRGRERDRDREPPPPRVQSVIFGMDNKYVLTGVKVEPIVTAEQLEPPIDGGVYVAPRTDPLWHLVKDPDSTDAKRVQSFRYGEGMSGLKALHEDRRRADRLEPGVRYRLTVESGKRRGELEFETKLAR